MPRYRFEEIAENCKEKMPAEEIDLSTYIGLEHLDSGCLNISRWGSPVPIKGDKLMMRKGDVLFGKRNAYLKRAAIAPFDGSFSAHGMIFRPHEKIIDKDFFPLFIASDYFQNEAIRISVGSLSPTVNWKDLKSLAFDLPEIEKQREFAKVLWETYNLIEAYKHLIQQSNELVKSQFVEMFGDHQKNPKGLRLCTIGEIAECYAGATPSTHESKYWDNGTIPWMASGEINLRHVYSTEKRITQLGYDKCSTRMVPAHTTLIALAGQGKTRGMVAMNEIELCTNQSLCAIILNESMLQDYLYINLLMRYEEIRNMCAIQDGRGGLNLKHIKSIKVLLPPMEQQEQFVRFVQQIDKSKFNAISTLKNLPGTPLPDRFTT